MWCLSLRLSGSSLWGPESNQKPIYSRFTRFQYNNVYIHHRVLSVVVQGHRATFRPDKFTPPPSHQTHPPNQHHLRIRNTELARVLNCVAAFAAFANSSKRFFVQFGSTPQKYVYNFCRLKSRASLCWCRAWYPCIVSLWN